MQSPPVGDGSALPSRRASSRERAGGSVPCHVRGPRPGLLMRNRRSPSRAGAGLLQNAPGLVLLPDSACAFLSLPGRLLTALPRRGRDTTGAARSPESSPCRAPAPAPDRRPSGALTCGPHRTATSERTLLGAFYFQTPESLKKGLTCIRVLLFPSQT